jgi:RNA polymerase sigma factor (sigma-70 family)
MQNKTYYSEVNKVVNDVLNRYFGHRVSWHDRHDYQNDIMEKIISKCLSHDETKGSLKTWVYKIVNNHIIDQERKLKTRKVVYKDDLSYYDRAEDDFEILLKEELEDRYTIFGDLLGALPKMDKEIIRLFYLEGLSNGEVASRLSLNEESLAMRRTRIKKRLKKSCMLRIQRE